jgi:hypothetical protein
LNSNGWIDWPDGSLMPGDLPRARRTRR